VHYSAKLSKSGLLASLRFLFAINRVNECYGDFSTVTSPFTATALGAISIVAGLPTILREPEAGENNLVD
jgi:hypothetical protein